MIQTEREENTARIFAALSDKTRLAIVRELVRGEKPCADLIAQFQLSKSTFSHHAKVLARCGMVQFRREGKFLFFSLNKEVLESTMSFFSI